MKPSIKSLNRKNTLSCKAHAPVQNLIRLDMSMTCIISGTPSWKPEKVR